MFNWRPAVRAVRFDRYGEVDVLAVREVDDPVATPGRVVVEVRAAAANPGDIAVRQGLAEAAWELRARLSPDAPRWAMRFPAGQGMDLAGVVVAVGADVPGFAVGDEVLGWSVERAAQAERVAVSADHLVVRPAGVDWAVAGSLFVAPMAALASVAAVAPAAGETVVVSGAAGAVGLVAVQLARRAGATVIGLAGEANHAWLRSLGVVPLRYGEGAATRIRDATGGRVDAFVDTFGADYVELAHELGVAPKRINTVVDFEAAIDHRAGIAGTNDAGGAAGLRRLVDLVADGALQVPVAATYPLTEVRDAYRRLAERRTRGKLVLVP